MAPMTQAFLFDLDGTLLDTRGDIADAANAARAALGLPTMAEAAVEGHVGHGLGHLLAQVLPRALHGRLGEARAAFVAHYQAHLLDRTRPFPGAEELLARLAGRPIALVTNQPGRFVDPILAGLGWHFEVVLAGDTLPERKPHPAPVREALRRLGVAAEQALFVGDTEVDRAAAVGAGVAVGCVPWGRTTDLEGRRLTSLAELVDRMAAP